MPRYVPGFMWRRGKLVRLRAGEYPVLPALVARIAGDREANGRPISVEGATWTEGESHARAFEWRKGRTDLGRGHVIAVNGRGWIHSGRATAAPASRSWLRAGGQRTKLAERSFYPALPVALSNDHRVWQVE